MSDQGSLRPWKVTFLAVSCALLIGNLYFVQPVAELVAAELHIPRARVGLLSTVPLAGYGLGLLLVAPIGDLVENRRLILAMVAAEALALLGMWFFDHRGLFLATSLVAGLCASAIQVILPYTSQFVIGARQGRAIASLVSGVMLGVMVARPTSSFLAAQYSWRTIYLVAAFLMLVTTAILAVALPSRRPAATTSYGRLLASMVEIFRTTEVLRRRAFYHTMMFGAFIAFWTSVPLLLARPPFSLSQSNIAWIALAGVAGAIAPPFATRLVDAGYIRGATIGAMALAMCGFAMTLLARDGNVAIIVVAAIALDSAASSHLVFGQRAIYALAPERRSRMNALFIASFFAGGAVISAASAWTFANYGWSAVVVLGVALPACGLLYRLTESRELGPT